MWEMRERRFGVSSILVWAAVRRDARVHRILDGQADSWKRRVAAKVLSMSSLYLYCWQLSRTRLRLIGWNWLVNQYSLDSFLADIYWGFSLCLIVFHWIAACDLSFTIYLNAIAVRFFLCILSSLQVRPPAICWAPACLFWSGASLVGLLSLLSCWCLPSSLSLSFVLSLQTFTKPLYPAPTK